MQLFSLDPSEPFIYDYELMAIDSKTGSHRGVLIPVSVAKEWVCLTENPSEYICLKAYSPSVGAHAGCGEFLLVKE